MRNTTETLGHAERSRAWLFFTLGGLALWIGATVGAGFVVRETNEFGGITNIDEVEDITRTVFLVGAVVFFSLMFGIAAWQTNRRARRLDEGLFARLAVQQVPPGLTRRLARQSTRITNVYLAFGASVTALGLLAVAASQEQQGLILWVISAFVMVWVVYGMYAIVRTAGGVNELFSYLGLELTGWPVFRYSWVSDRGWMSGAVSYGGTRAGRSVSISHHTHHAVISVSAPIPAHVPTDAAAMSMLTGLPVKIWRNTTAVQEDGQVFVHRSTNGAGSWVLHDLLLAEAIVATTAAPHTVPPPPPPGRVMLP
jgi:hypothetical protein